MLKGLTAECFDSFFGLPGEIKMELIVRNTAFYLAMEFPELEPDLSPGGSDHHIRPEGQIKTRRTLWDTIIRMRRNKIG
jgi:hypothetical protein